jgi:hypothetical protein
MKKVLTVNGTRIKVDVEPGKFYVVDTFGEGPGAIEGPYDTRREAEKDRRASNIAGDCIVIQAPAEPTRKEDPGPDDPHGFGFNANAHHYADPSEG